MTLSQASDPKPAQKLLAAHAIKIRIAVGSGLVLAVGAWLTPPAAPTALSAPQERPAPLLEEQVQLREWLVPFVVCRMSRLERGITTRPSYRPSHAPWRPTTTFQRRLLSSAAAGSRRRRNSLTAKPRDAPLHR